MTYQKVWYPFKVFSTAIVFFFPLFYSRPAHPNQCLIPTSPQTEFTDAIATKQEEINILAPESLKPIQTEIPETYSTTKNFIEAKR